MRIQHNIMALNASNRLKANDSAISSNIAKLSSGYRINSAADDAAGLAVSEKMRSQINGLNQAEDNAENGISLVQTAEGGLNETSSILQRMNTLAVESANGTYQDGTDRANLQKEVTALQSEIDRISSSTNFNQINLLDGSLGGKASVSSVADFTGIPTGALSSVQNATAEVQGISLSSTVGIAGKYSTNITNTTASLSNGASLSFTVNYNDANGVAHSQALTYTASTDLSTVGDVTNAIGGYIADTVKDSSGDALFTYATGTLTASANGAAEITGVTGTGLTSAAPANNGTAATNDYSIAYTDANGVSKTFTTSITGYGNDDIAGKLTAAINADSGLGGIFTAATTGTAGSLTVQLSAKTAGTGEGKITSAGLNATATETTAAADAYQTLNAGLFTPADSNNNTFSVDGHKFAFVTSDTAGAALGSDVTYVVASAIDNTAAASMASRIQQQTGLTASAGATGTDISIYGKVQTTSTDGVTFQVGSDNVDNQRASLSIGDMSSNGLGVSGVNISTQSGAETAIDTIKAAINKVDGTRADLGALQNELEHTENNLSTMSENLTSAESQIRDVDMSDEYVDYSKNQILSQAATAMLAQANTQPQNVLTLLKG